MKIGPVQGLKTVDTLSLFNWEISCTRKKQQKITNSSLSVASISCRSFCLSLALSPATFLLPKLKMGKNAPLAASLSALRVTNLQLLSSSSATVLSNSPLKEQPKSNSQTCILFTDLSGHKNWWQFRIEAYSKMVNNFFLKGKKHTHEHFITNFSFDVFKRCFNAVYLPVSKD